MEPIVVGRCSTDMTTNGTNRRLLGSGAFVLGAALAAAPATLAATGLMTVDMATDRTVVSSSDTARFKYKTIWVADVSPDG